jgi:hypothetical protein
MSEWNLILLLGVSAIWVGFVTAMAWLVAESRTGR